MWRIKKFLQMISFMVFFSILLGLMFIWADVPTDVVLAIVIAFDIFAASSWDWL